MKNRSVYSRSFDTNMTSAVVRLGIVVLFGLLLVPRVGAEAFDAPRLEKRDMKAHERCLVCGTELTPSDGLAFYYRGRPIAISKKHLQMFLQNPDRYFNHLEARGALFQEGAAQPISGGWLVLGVWILLGLVGAAICTGVAFRKGLSPLSWFAAGLLLNIVSVLLVLARSSAQKVELPPRLAKIPNTVQSEECPQCGTRNHPTAKRCNGCDAEMKPLSDSEVNRIDLAEGE